MVLFIYWCVRLFTQPARQLSRCMCNVYVVFCGESGSINKTVAVAVSLQCKRLSSVACFASHMGRLAVRDNVFCFTCNTLLTTLKPLCFNNSTYSGKVPSVILPLSRPLSRSLSTFLFFACCYSFLAFSVTFCLRFGLGGVAMKKQGTCAPLQVTLAFCFK